MATASFEYCGNWRDVHTCLKQGLRDAGYPNFGGTTGGNGNICCIAGRYNLFIFGFWHKDTYLYSSEDSDYNFVIVARNHGMGGTHSEPAGLLKVQSRNLARGDLYLFTERAPCQSCQQRIGAWADTFDRDIIVQYRTPYTDTNTEIDLVMRQVGAVSAADARKAVKEIRASFS